MLHINDRPDAPGTGQNNLKQLFAGLYNHHHQMITHLKKAQFLAPLIFRLFLTFLDHNFLNIIPYHLKPLLPTMF